MKHNLTVLSGLLVLSTGLINAEMKANAYNLVYDSTSSINGVSFVYDLELAPDEKLYNFADSPNFFADVLNFTDLSGITNVSTDGTYDILGFDDTTVNLEVSTTTENNTGLTMILQNIVTIFSNAAIGMVNFDATFDEGDGTQLGQIVGLITGPTTVPEPSIVLGLATTFGLGALFNRKHK